MADKQITELPAASGVTDDTLIPAYVPGSSDPAQSLTGKQFKAFAKEGVSAYVEAAQEAAQNALAAAQKAQDAVASVQGAAEEAAAAQAANVAAQAAMQAAKAAQAAAEAAAQSAADDATADVASNMQSYVQAAQAAQKAAETARDQAQAIAGGDFLPLAGGTLTGPLVLAGEPTEDAQATPKSYVDAAIQTAKPIAITATLTVAGWDSTAKTQTVAVTGVLADGSNQLVDISLADRASAQAWAGANIWCDTPGADSLTFSCETVPTADINLNIELVEVTVG